MHQLLAKTLTHLTGWLTRKAQPPMPALALRGPAFLDAYRRVREPTAGEMLAELKNTAWTCASINAAVCASYPPRLYVTTSADEAAPKCLTRPLPEAQKRQLYLRADLALRLKNVQRVEEVVEHPLLTLLRQVNSVHNAFDLWELTQFYLEVHGSAYWYLELDEMLAIPAAIWVLPAHQVAPGRREGSRALVDYYEYRNGSEAIRYDAETIIHFRFPDPRNPYLGGLSPLRACYEQVALLSEYAAMKRSIYDNVGLPRAVLSPSEVLSMEERDRLEQQWERRFSRGGAGKVLVSEAGLKVDVLERSMGDLAALADMKATKEDIANAFHVPLPFLTGDTNLANMQAADHLHKTVAIAPRLRRRDEKINEQMLPFYDPTGRLFVMSEDPTPQVQDHLLKLQEADLKYGVRTINELRTERGLPPVPWGDKPFTPSFPDSQHARG